MPAIRQNIRTNRSHKADRKEKMDELLFGKYRVLRLLANGSGGEVFLAEHKILGERRIIKRLRSNRPFYEERKKEAQTLKCLHHVAIPRIYDIEEDDTGCYIIEEDMGGETLSDFLSRQKCLPTSFISNYSIQLCEIIEYLHHNGILYLDIKPENIMINGEKLALIDFGGAVQMSEPVKVVFGTTGYAAPEQYRGTVGECSDVFGIGCVLGVMLGNDSKGREEIRRIQERCVHPIASKRYPNVQTVKEELLHCSGKKMRRKGKRDVRDSKFIGVIDVHEGAEGVAWCTLLAAYINERKKGRIACIDLSGGHVFERLYEGLFGADKIVPEEFVLWDVCYVPEGTTATVGTYAAKGYATLLLYFGQKLEKYKTEFLRCDYRFAYGTGYPWRCEAWKRLAELLTEIDVEREITAVLSGGEKQILPIRFKKVIELPFITDPLYADRKTEKKLSSVLDCF